MAPAPAHGFAGAVGRLAVANAVAVAVGLLTGPLQARALGPEGRGALAAILVPLTLAPFIAGLGVPSFAAREAARGRSVRTLVGSLGLLCLVTGLLAMAAAEPLAGLVAGGRDTVHRYVLIGLLLMPLSLVAQMLIGVATGLQRWRPVILSRLILPLGSLASVLVLYLLDALTVASAAITFLVAAVASTLPVLGLGLQAGRPSVDRGLIAGAVPFSAKAWLGSLGSLANARLDQLLMTRLVAERELGLYVVAATVASFSTILTSALGSALFPRVAAGDRLIPARALRVTLALVGASSAVLALAAPPILRLLFGAEFAAAGDMTRILLAAGVPLAGVAVLVAALTGAGRPGAAAAGEGLTLAVTVPGLVILLSPLGGLGAALVSLAAYGVTFAYLLAVARRQFELPLSAFLVVRVEDLGWAAELVRQRVRRGSSP